MDIEIPPMRGGLLILLHVAPRLVIRWCSLAAHWKEKIRIFPTKKIEEKILTELREILISVRRTLIFAFNWHELLHWNQIEFKHEKPDPVHGNQDFSKLSQYFSFNFFLLERYVFPLSNEPLTSIIRSLVSAPQSIELVDPPPSGGVFQYPCSCNHATSMFLFLVLLWRKVWKG